MAGGDDELRGLADEARGTGGEQKPKRQKLKSYDQMPAQILNPNGESGMAKTSLKQLCKAMAAGNKAAPFFNELCDPLPQRKGIAISRLSEVYLAVGAKLMDEKHYKKYLEKKLYEESMTEFVGLKPHFEMLMGKGIAIEDDDAVETVGKIAYGSGGGGQFKETAR